MIDSFFHRSPWSSRQGADFARAASRARRRAPDAGRADGRSPAGDRRLPPGEVRAPPASRKLTFNEQREFDRLPGRIETLETEQRALSARVAGTEFYKEGAAGITSALARLDELQAALASAYARWDELGSREEGPGSN